MAARSSSGKSKAALDPALPQKKRARRRLVGAAAVCLAAAIVLPLVLDSEPRRIRDDVQVRIPSRDTPLSDRSDASSSRRDEAEPPAADGASGAAPTGADRDAGARAEARPEPAPPAVDPKDQADERKAPDDSRAAQPAAPGPAARAPEPGEPKAPVKPSAKAPAPKGADDPIARLALAKDAGGAKADGYIVQIGAFSSAKGASEQVERAGKAGFKAFTERVATAQGERIRVRVGPFATRDAADQARAKLRSAGLESVLVAP